MKRHRLFFAAWLFCLAALGATQRVAASRPHQDSHEYAPLQTVKLNYRDWTYPALTGDAVNLRTWAKNKKLVLVVYFAPWCGNWRYESEVVARLYAKYREHGFGVIAVNEYGAAAEAKAFFGANGPPYPVVIESEDRAKVGETPHALYRRLTGDFRTYGSPYNVFIEPAAMNATGEVLAEHVTVANGELIEAEAEAFIREKLGLPASDPASKAPDLAARRS
ncbi:MAG: TlpA family protein disulfide reductase [Chloracidobacterium sp.]|nr:TlpA family protein disulfide reductase [Chloracidobacterium sp.]MDW8217494.1 TlpA disulfide reductase family protein [Acidobacteriota bacterium]